jgi:hypothetical protein
MTPPWEGLVKAGVVKPIDAVDDLVATGTAKETCTQKTRKPRTRCDQQSAITKPCSPQSPIDAISHGNDLLDEYVHNTQKFQTVKEEVAYQHRRFEWVQSVKN